MARNPTPAGKQKAPSYTLLSEIVSGMAAPEKASMLRRALLNELRQERSKLRGFETQDTFNLPLPEGETQKVHDVFLYDTPVMRKWIAETEHTLKPPSRSRYYRPSLREIAEGQADLSRAEEDTRSYLQSLRKRGKRTSSDEGAGEAASGEAAPAPRPARRGARSDEATVDSAQSAASQFGQALEDDQDFT